ncbi:MAG: arsenic resistance protein [Nitrosomonas sp.]|nr:arsenic resistance protein [Nitrosomonas sp.]
MSVIDLYHNKVFLRMKNVRASLEEHQVLIYFLAIASGALLGIIVSGSASIETAINPALAVMLFATFLQTPLAEIGVALRNVRFIGALVVTNFVAIPVVVAGLVQLLPNDPMLHLAVLFVLLTPCIDYVITFTHLGRGNARLLLAMTPILLVFQILLLPVYLQLILSGDVSQLVDPDPFLHAFCWLIVAPLILAGVIQTFFRPRHALCYYVNILPVPATALVLFVVLASVTPQIGLAQSSALRAVPIYLSFAIVAPVMGYLIARGFRLESTSVCAVSFSSSYRNSLVILPLAFAIPGGVPILPAVILMQTIIELCFLPIYVRWIPRMALVQTGGSTGIGN